MILNYIALLAYRTSPLSNGYSPSQILMRRQLRSRIPVTQESLLPKQIPFERIVETDKYLQQQQKSDYDRQHRSLG